MQSCRSLQSSLTLQTSQVLQDFCKMTFYIQNVTVYTLFVFVYKKKLKFPVKHIRIQSFMWYFKSEINRNYIFSETFSYFE